EALGALWSREASGAQIIAMAFTATYLLHQGVYALSEDLLSRLSSIEAEVRDPRVRARIDLSTATRALVQGDPGRHLRLTAAAVAHFSEAGDRRNACMAQITLGVGHCNLGAYAQAEQEMREALAVAERMGLPNHAAYARHILGFALARTGALEE